MKYIVYNQGHVQDMVVLFNRITDHSVMFRQLGHDVELVSAGFVYLSTKNGGIAVVSCHGKSTSLNVKSRPEIDSEIITNIFYNDRSY